MRKSGLVLFVALAGICSLFSVLVVAPAEAFNLPDTGQTKCYEKISPWAETSCKGTGQDGEYSINPMSYTDHGNGTVTDNNTGLMWQQQDDGIEYNWHVATGTPDDTYNSESADFCKELRTGNYTDWRLPTEMELMSIADYSVPPAGPTIKTTYFPDTKPAYYWTSSTCDSNTGEAWYVDFEIAKVDCVTKHGGSYVRCVRGEQSIQSFSDNGNYTVKDNKTGLIWQQDEQAKKNWNSALSYCEGLIIGGYSDWRLPNIKELQSLIDDTRSNPAINTKFFPGAVSSYYWSSTNYITGEGWMYGVLFSDGYVRDVHISSNDFYVRCVRGKSGAFDIMAKARGTGAGRMTSSPAGIYYSYPVKNSGTALFGENSTVTVTAKANTGSTASWNSTCKTAGGTESGNNSLTAACRIKVTKAAAVTATFTQYYTITAKANGTGKGSVVSAPAGISYKYPAKKTDSGSYAKGSMLKVSAKANSGYKASWNNTCKKAGGTEKGDNTRTAVCTIKVAKAAVVTATFRK